MEEDVRVGIIQESLPLRECGLKYADLYGLAPVEAVTPLAGVWIEMSNIDKYVGYVVVTPLAGVWIEIAS